MGGPWAGARLQNVQPLPAHLNAQPSGVIVCDREIAN